jgi:hypothetical protein
MFETLKRLYEANRITEIQLDNAVNKGYISEEQKNIILGGNENESSI